MFHRFENAHCSNAIPSQFPNPFYSATLPLVREAAAALQQYVWGHAELCQLLADGKMLGVLVVQNEKGELGYLTAYSGSLPRGVGEGYFVPSIFDALDPQGWFKVKEAQISALNGNIEALEKSADYGEALERVATMREEIAAEVRAGKAWLKSEKERREAVRKSGVSESEAAELLKESRHQKGEQRRKEQRLKQELNGYEQQLEVFKNRLAAWQQQRKEESQALQQWLFSQYRVRNGLGEEKDLLTLFSEQGQSVPPGGAGDCAGPKLLHAAWCMGYTPIALGEFWWGKSDVNAMHVQGHFYPSCESKCRPILSYMLQGVEVQSEREAQQQELSGELRVVYEDNSLMVVDKPSGMLSVPGRQEELNVEELLQQQAGVGSFRKVAHRLDMDTSGLLVVAKSNAVLALLQRQFESRQVKKVYVALLQGEVLQDNGTITLPLCANIEERPRQMVSYEMGKDAVTNYEVLERQGERTRVRFMPQTGRTHQLRVHAAHALGLNAPICGDRLYGNAQGRLCLHAAELQFIHPISGEIIALQSGCVF